MGISSFVNLTMVDGRCIVCRRRRALYRVLAPCTSIGGARSGLGRRATESIAHRALWTTLQTRMDFQATPLFAFSRTARVFCGLELIAAFTSWIRDIFFRFADLTAQRWESFSGSPKIPMATNG